jgi:hypothetical protein
MRGDEARKSFRPVIKRQILLGTPVTTGAYTVTPASRVFLVQLPFASLCWQRPHAVLVASGGEARRLPIPDATRRAEVGIVASVFLLLGIVRIASAHRKESQP